MRTANTVLMGALGGFLIAFSLPPWGWWPLAFVGFAIIDYLCGAASTGRIRFLAGWAAGLVWLAMGELWMFDLTSIGYVFVFVVFGAGYGLIALTVGNGDARIVGLPAGFVLYEWFRWSWPFGGVPLATVPMTQVDSPLAGTLPVGGGLLLTAATVATGVALRLLIERQFARACIISGAVATLLLTSAIVPTGEVVGELDVAVVQGGGAQRTRADTCDNQAVFDRHRQATESINRPVDLIVWPENVVNPIADGSPLGRCDDLLYMTEAIETTARIARAKDAVLIPGWFHSAGRELPGRTVNYSTAIDPQGRTVDRYDKVQTVPFGEFVPLRGFIEQFSDDIPARDAVAGTGPAVLESPAGTLGVSISWEIFFERRGRAAIRDGGEVLINPTNGSSYWLTILQSQQIASSRLRALETGRWVLQAAPTGFSAVVDPSGNVVERTGTSEQRVLYATIERREGLTPNARLGPAPFLVVALVAFAFTITRRTYSPPAGP